MPLPIKEIGGLPEGEIRLLIEECADKRESTLDTKLSAHREAINKRLERTEDVVQASQTRLADLQGDVSGLTVTIATISEDNKEQTRLLQQVVEQGRTWHDDDIAFRNGVDARLTHIESEQRTLTVQVKRLHWISVTTGAAVRATKFTLDKLGEAEFWKLAGVAIILWFAKLFSPLLYHKLAQLLTK